MDETKLYPPTEQEEQLRQSVHTDDFPFKLTRRVHFTTIPTGIRCPGQSFFIFFGILAVIFSAFRMLSSGIYTPPL